MQLNIETNFFEKELFGSYKYQSLDDSKYITQKNIQILPSKELKIDFNETEREIFENMAKNCGIEFEREYRKCLDLKFPKLTLKDSIQTTNVEIDTKLFNQSYFEKDSNQIVQLKTENLKNTNKVRDVDKFLKEKSVLNGIEKQIVAPVNKKKEKTKKAVLKGWFDMEAPDMTPELEEEITALRLRHTSAGKTKFEKEEREELPKFFQIGRVIEPATEFFDRRKKKDRKRTFLDELIHDQKEGNYIEQRYKQIKKK